MVIDTTQKFGWRFEVDGDDVGTIETDPISDNGSPKNDPNDRYWKMGINTNTFTFYHAMEQHDWQAVYYSDKVYPQALNLVSSKVQEVLGFHLVNLIPFYMVMTGGGINHSVASNVHTINFRDIGQPKDTFTVRSESTGGTDAKYLSAVGCKARSLGITFDLFQQFHTIAATLVYEGITSAASTSLNATHVSGPVFPTTNAEMDGTQVNTRFKHDTNFAFHWDSADSDEDFTTYLKSFNCQIIDNMNVLGQENQADPEFIDSGTKSVLFGFELLRGNTIEVRTDFLARTQHDFYISWGVNTAAPYLKLSFDDVGLNQCKENHAKLFGTNRTEPVWDVMGIAENITVLGRDGLDGAAAATEFYGEATP